MNCNIDLLNHLAARKRLQIQSPAPGHLSLSDGGFSLCDGMILSLTPVGLCPQPLTLSNEFESVAATPFYTKFPWAYRAAAGFLYPGPVFPWSTGRVSTNTSLPAIAHVIRVDCFSQPHSVRQAFISRTEGRVLWMDGYSHDRRLAEHALHNSLFVS